MALSIYRSETKARHSVITVVSLRLIDLGYSMTSRPLFNINLDNCRETGDMRIEPFQRPRVMLQVSVSQVLVNCRLQQRRLPIPMIVDTCVIFQCF